MEGCDDFEEAALADLALEDALDDADLAIVDFVATAVRRALAVVGLAA